MQPYWLQVTTFSLACLGRGTASKLQLKRYTRYSHVFYNCILLRYCLPFYAQYRWRLRPVGKGSNKVQGSQNSEEYYREDGINREKKYKRGQNVGQN